MTAKSCTAGSVCNLNRGFCASVLFLGDGLRINTKCPEQRGLIMLELHHSMLYMCITHVGFGTMSLQRPLLKYITVHMEISGLYLEVTCSASVMQEKCQT